MSKQLEQVPYFSQHHVQVAGACGVCSLASLLNTNNVASISVDELIKVAVQHKLLSTQGNGLTWKHLIKLGELFGTVEYGFAANDPNAHSILYKYMEQGLPVLVAAKVNLFHYAKAIGHAMVVCGIDLEKNVTIADSFSRIKKRSPVDNSAEWIPWPGKYVATWQEFDPSWNTKDEYYTTIDLSEDEVFKDYDPNEEDCRFWMVVKKKQ